MEGGILVVKVFGNLACQKYKAAVAVAFCILPQSALILKVIILKMKHTVIKI